MKNSSENPEYQNKIKKPLTEHLPTGQADGVYSYTDYLTLEFDEIVEIIKG